MKELRFASCSTLLVMCCLPVVTTATGLDACLAPVDANELAPGNFLFGGTKDLFSSDDFVDLRGRDDARAAVDWYLHSGITNAGDSWDRFAPDQAVPRWELAHALYRFYSNMNEQGAPFTDVPILFGQPGADTSKERKFFVAATTLRGAGVLDADAQGNFLPDNNLTVEDMLLWVHRTLNNKDSSVAAGVRAPEGTRADLARFTDADKVSTHAVSAVAGMIKAGCYQPAGIRLEPQGNVSRLTMVRLLYALRHTPVPKKMNEYAERRLKAALLADAKTQRVRNGDFSLSTPDNTVLYARNGAMVEMVDTRIVASQPLNAPDSFAYRWGLGGVVLANGYGTQIDINTAQISSTGENAYALYATSGGTLNIRNSVIDGGRAAMVTYNGRVNLDNVVIRGTDRTYSSDHFGGIITYRHVDSQKTSARMGGGGFFLDENTTGEFYDSLLKGDGFLAVITGIGRAYFKDTVINMRTGIEFTNNTSMLSDVATATFDGGSITLSGGDLFTSKKMQREIIRLNGVKVSLPAGARLLKLEQQSRARLYLKDVDITGDIIVEAGSSAEVYLTNARLHGRISGDVKIQADDQSVVERRN